MSAQFIAAKAQGNQGNPTAPDTTMSPSEKAALDKVYGGDNPSVELTPEALKAADDFTRGAIPEVTPAAKKPDGAVAAEPDPQKTPEEIAAAEEAAKAAEAEKAKVEEEPTVEKTPEELAAEAEAAKGEKTPEELAAEEEAATAAAEATKAAEEKAKLEEAEEEPTRMRVRKENFATEFEWDVARLMRTGMTAEAALAAVKAMPKHLGKTDPEKPVLTPEVNALLNLQAERKTKRAEMAKAIAEYRNEDAAKLSTEIDELNDKIDDTKVAVNQSMAYDRAVESSISRASAEFPDSLVQGHPLFDAIELAFLRLPADSPRRNDPNFPEIIAKECADKLKISGKSAKPAATPPSVTPPKSTAKPTPKVAPISGKARQVTPPTKPEDELDAALRKELGPKNAHMVGRAAPVM